MKNEIYKKKYNFLINILSRVRQEKGIRQIDLAKKLNVPQSFVSKYESGERRIDAIELIIICDELEIEISSLIKEISIPKNE